MEKSIDADLLEGKMAVSFMLKTRANRLRHMRAYRAKHPEVIKAISKRYYQKRKLEDPERQKALNRRYTEKRRAATMVAKGGDRSGL